MQSFIFIFLTLTMNGIAIFSNSNITYQYASKFIYTENSKGRATPMCCREKWKQPIKK